MREFSAEYLDATRRGMWDDSRAALANLDLDARSSILDVGCGTGELSRVLEEESSGEVVGVDADRGLLDAAPADLPTVVGDATQLPFRNGAFDLVVCQALLINLPDPAAAVREFARVSDGAVAAIEPDNAAVTVDSTVDAEPRLERRARAAYLEGIETDVTLGGDGTRAAFDAAGLRAVRSTRYDHVRRVEPPYTDDAIESAQRKASGAALREDRETMLAGTADPELLDDLRAAWRSMGRTVIEQMQAGEYRRREVVPFFVTVGTVPEDAEDVTGR